MSNSKPKQKKGARGWTTDDQLEFLESQKPAYLKAQAARKLPDLWPTVYEAWFERWRFQADSNKEKYGTPQDQLERIKVVSDSIHWRHSTILDSLLMISAHSAVAK
jgi:hypothetical protein